MLLTADFETTTREEDCRVWCYGLCEIGNTDNFSYGYSIDEMFDYLYETQENNTLYFHNLKFDGEFILVWLFENGYTWVKERKELESKTFTTLISDKGQFYSMEICHEKKSRNSKKTIIYDSFKIIPFSVANVAKAFNLPIHKLELDYDYDRPVGYRMTQQEIDYLHNDVEIPARALHTLFSQGLTCMTQGSNALSDYKAIVGKKNFEKWYPIPDYDSDVRKSYKGGFTYLNPKYKNKDVGKGIVLDVNSLYPSVMYYCPLPYGEPIYFNGRYKEDDLYNLYIQRFSCSFEIKEGMIPTIQLKNNLSFVPTEYVTSSNDEEIIFTLTNVDLELFLEHYDVYNIEWMGGYKFKSTIGLFKDYIDKWSKVKIESSLNGNKGMRTLAKLMLNALYGKFALNPQVTGKMPYYENGAIKYSRMETEYRDPIYIPIGTFITAHARNKTIRSAQTVYDRFIYADTDSLHLEGEEIPDGLEIDATKLGAWKHESSFDMGRFIRAKTYMERERTYADEMYRRDDGIKVRRDSRKVRKPTFVVHGKMDDRLRNRLRTADVTVILKNKITCAGLPERCYKWVTWDNFREGAVYGGKLTYKHVKGGIILRETNFSIK